MNQDNSGLFLSKNNFALGFCFFKLLYVYFIYLIGMLEKFNILGNKFVTKMLDMIVNVFKEKLYQIN